MFVPKAASRNPRRRPRTSSDDSVKPPKAKRQRSVLRQAGDTPSVNADHENTQDTTGTHVPVTLGDQPGGGSALPIRAAKPIEEPVGELDGSVVLVGFLHHFP